MKILLATIYIIFTTSGLTLIKLGGNAKPIISIFGINLGWLGIVGICCYGISFILWQKLLTTYDLTYIVPVTAGLIQIIVFLVGTLLFKENVNWYGLLGIVLIVAGVVLLSIKR